MEDDHGSGELTYNILLGEETKQLRGQGTRRIIYIDLDITKSEVRSSDGMTAGQELESSGNEGKSCGLTRTATRRGGKWYTFT